MQLFTMRQAPQSAPVYPTSTPAWESSRPRTTYRVMPATQRAALRQCPPPVPAPAPEDPNLPRDIASRFGRRVRELRQARSMTQLEVAVHFGIDRTFISDVERGRKGVCLPTMEVFALGFGVSLSDLLRGL